jgi:hypothetical protein
MYAAPLAVNARIGVEEHLPRCAPKQQIVHLGPQLPELLKHATRKLAIIHQPYGIFIAWMRQWELYAAAVWMLRTRFVDHASLDLLPEQSQGRPRLHHRSAYTPTATMRMFSSS